MIVLIILAVILAVILVLFYVLGGRAWLKKQPWAQGFFAWIEPYEIMLFKKSETILKARTQMAIGVLLTVLTQLGTIDLSPLMPFVPDKYEGLLRVTFNLLPLVLTALGWMDEKLRNTTTKPIETVALPDKDVTPAVAAAVANVKAATAEAVVTAESKV